MIRLGCAIRVLGKPGLKPYDTRHWQSNPHLSVSLAYLLDIILYLQKVHIHVYRMSPDLAPYITHPDLPEFHHQIDEALPELEHVGALARSHAMRLTFHAPAHVVLSSENDALVDQSRRRLEALARILDAMGLGPESVIVLHVGGGYKDPRAALERFCQRVESLPPLVRERLAVEHDDTTFDLDDVLWVHQRTGLPVVFDLLHHRLLNRRGLSVADALARALATWPKNMRPKVHLASPNTAARHIRHHDPFTGRRFITVHPPLLNQHSDFIHPFDAILLLDLLRGKDVDVMVEAKGGDIAVQKVRQDVRRLAPRLASELEGRVDRDVEELAFTEEMWQGLPEEAGERVLVVVMNNLRDFHIVREEGWYRIPVKHAPDRLAADYLAFYLTRVFGPERWSIPYMAPVRRYRLLRRRDLLPEEPDHPRADEWYYKIELGPLQRLPHPVPSRHLRRVTFIPTTLQRLLTAEEINDLWLSDALQEQLYKTLVAHRLPVQRDPGVAEEAGIYDTGLVIPCAKGKLTVIVGHKTIERKNTLLVHPRDVAHRLDEVVKRVQDVVEELGGPASSQEG